MKLKEIMKGPMCCVEGSGRLEDAAREMSSGGVGMLPVMEGGNCIGVVTDRDLVVRGLAKGEANCSVRDVMTPNPVTLSAEADVNEAIRTMESRKIGRIVVTGADGTAQGVVSAGAIALAYRGRQEVGELASDLSAAHSANRGNAANNIL